MASFDLTSPVVLELRAARPRAPEALRERVLARAADVREPRFSLPRLEWRRIALVAVPACLAVAVGAALVHGAFNAGAPQRQAVRTKSHAHIAGPRPALRGEKAAPATALDKFSEKVPVPSRTRLQDYRAILTVRVDDLDALSSATRQAMGTIHRLGGYVVSAQLGQAKKGHSFLVFRVPVQHVQQALARFAQLGAIASQDIRISDLQGKVDRLGRLIDNLRVRIAKIDDRLADPSLSNAERVELELRRARLERTLNALAGRRGQAIHRARYSTVSLTLTTKHAAAVHHNRGPLGRALDDAGTILAKEAAWGLYALIVLGPLAVIALAAYLLVRAGRRVADRRLLESS